MTGVQTCALPIFFPNLGGSGPQTIFSVLFIAMYVIRNKTKIVFPIFFYIFVFGLAIVLFLVFINGILFSLSIDRYYIVLYVKVLIVSLGLYSLIMSSKISPKHVYKALLVVLSLNVIATYVQYFDIFGLKDFAFSLNRNFDFTKYVVYRAMGMMSGYDLNGIFLATTSLLFIIYSDTYADTIVAKRISTIVGIFSAMGTLLAARTGIVALLIMFLIYFIVKTASRGATKVFRLFVSSAILIGSLYLFISIIDVDLRFQIDNSMDFVFEAIDNYRNFGVLSTDSFQITLNEHYFLPSTSSQLWFGNTLPNHVQFNQSDVGYVQVISGLGVLGLISFILVHFLLGLEILLSRNTILKRNSKLISKQYSVLSLFGYSYLFVIFVVSFKGPYFFSEGIFYIFIIIVCLIYKLQNDAIIPLLNRL